MSDKPDIQKLTRLMGLVSTLTDAISAVKMQIALTAGANAAHLSAQKIELETQWLWAYRATEQEIDGETVLKPISPELQEEVMADMANVDAEIRQAQTFTAVLGAVTKALEFAAKVKAAETPQPAATNAGTAEE